MYKSTSLWNVGTSEDKEITTVSEPWSCQYAISRSAEGRQCDEPNQDYLHLLADANRLAFAVCDGVSMSFCGQIAARLVGIKLTEWLFAQRPLQDEQERQKEIAAWLNDLCQVGSASVQAYALPEQMNPIVRDVLEEKRRKGSESAFVAGVIETFATNDDVVLELCWLGDIRVRLWINEKEVVMRDPSTVCTEERWSTHKGCIGQLHVKKYQWTANQAESIKLVVYSDGLALIDSCVQPPDELQLAAMMNESLKMANSDDMTFVSIHLNNHFQDEVESCQ